MKIGIPIVRILLHLHFAFCILQSITSHSCPPPNRNFLPPDLMAQLERLELVTRKVFRGRMKGERRSKRKGQSVEFADFRSYVPGDDLRSLDWNLYARLDKLIVKLFLEEEDLHFFTLIDASLSMDFGEPTKLQYAKQLAAALGFVGLIRTDRVRIETLGPARAPARRRCCAAGKSVWRMLEYLDGIEAGRNGVAGRGRQELLPAQRGQRDRRADHRPDGQERLRAGAAVPGVAADGRVRDPRAQPGGARSRT